MIFLQPTFSPFVTLPLFRTNYSPLTKFSTQTPRDAKLVERLQTQLKEIKDAGTFKKERIITSPQRASIEVSTSDGKKTEVLNFW
jgi:hypothetical protein